MLDVFHEIILKAIIRLWYLYLSLLIDVILHNRSPLNFLKSLGGRYIIWIYFGLCPLYHRLKVSKRMMIPKISSRLFVAYRHQHQWILVHHIRVHILIRERIDLNILLRSSINIFRFFSQLTLYILLILLRKVFIFIHFVYYL